MTAEDDKWDLQVHVLISHEPFNSYVRTTTGAQHLNMREATAVAIQKFRARLGDYGVVVPTHKDPAVEIGNLAQALADGGIFYV